jgi:hypothetical protein
VVEEVGWRLVGEGVFVEFGLIWVEMKMLWDGNGLDEIHAKAKIVYLFCQDLG